MVRVRFWRASYLLLQSQDFGDAYKAYSVLHKGCMGVPLKKGTSWQKS